MASSSPGKAEKSLSRGGSEHLQSEMTTKSDIIQKLFFLYEIFTRSIGLISKIASAVAVIIKKNHDFSQYNKSLTNY